MNITEFELGWCVALFEGEGSVFICRQRRQNKIYIYPRASLKMTDEDIVRRFHMLVGCGRFHHQSKKTKANLNPNWKYAFTWQLTSRVELIKLMSLFYPHLGKRRQQQIMDAGLMEQVDMTALKAVGSNAVRVQISQPAPGT